MLAIGRVVHVAGDDEDTEVEGRGGRLDEEPLVDVDRGLAALHAAAEDLGDEHEATAKVLPDGGDRRIGGRADRRVDERPPDGRRDVRPHLLEDEAEVVADWARVGDGG